MCISNNNFYLLFFAGAPSLLSAVLAQQGLAGSTLEGAPIEGSLNQNRQLEGSVATSMLLLQSQVSQNPFTFFCCCVFIVLKTRF